MLFKRIKGIHINGRKEMSTENGIVSFMDPKFIYLPINAGNIVYKPLVQVGDVVLKGQAVLEREGRFGHPICSPVSGEVVSIKKCWHPIGKMVEMLEIANNGKEETVEGWGQPLSEISKETIIERVKNAGIVGMGGAGFPTYVKYLPVEEAEVVLINAAECEPYLTADYTLILNETEKLMRGIEYLMIATGAKTAKIAIKKTKIPAITALNAALVNHPNISVFLLKDIYPAGWEKYIVETVTGKTYTGLPSEVGAVVNNVQTTISVADAVEQNIPLVEKLVTFTGEGLNKPCNVNLKIGTKVSDVIPLIDGYKEDLPEAYFIAGGPMTGKAIMFDDLVITNSLGSVIVKIKNEHPANACMGCGKCAEVCPVFLTPTEIKGAFEAGDTVTLEKLNANKCIQCGLCSYICPSRIEMTEYVGKAKDALAKAVAMKNARK